MNDVVSEIVALAGGKVRKIDAAMQTQFQEGLPLIREIGYSCNR